MALHGASDPLVRIHGDRALLHQYLVAIDRPRNLGGDRLDVREIRMARIALRCTDRDEDHFAGLHCCGEIRGEADGLTIVLLQQFGKMFFVNNGDAVAQSFCLTRVVIDADNFVSDLCKTNRGYETYVTRANHCNLYATRHVSTSSSGLANNVREYDCSRSKSHRLRQ